MGEERPKPQERGEAADNADGDGVGDDKTLEVDPDFLNVIAKVVGDLITKSGERRDEDLIVEIAPPIRATNEQ